MTRHLGAVPGLPDEAIFTTVAVCSTCPPGRIGFSVGKREGDWDVTVWHVEPCPLAWDPVVQRGSAPRSVRVPGCEVCHAWHGADVQGGTAVLPGFWAFHVKHGRGPLTSQDGSVAAAAGGDYCPLMEADNARVMRVAAKNREAGR